MIINEIDFNVWFNDGNAIRQKGYYLEQTTQWKKKFTLTELRNFYTKEYLN
jgi:hypothetical protein